MMPVRTALPALLLIGTLLGGSRPAWGQDPSPSSSPLAALLAEADSSSHRIHAALSSAEGAAARVPQAGALPDPMLGVGVMNVPVTDLGIGNDMMTMTQVQLSTRLPWPGKLGLQEDAAELRAEAAEWETLGVRNAVRSDVKAAYYEIYFVDRALAVVSRNLALLGDFADLASAMYAVGTGRQPDVLRAQVERTRLEEQRVGLRARRESATARLNALLGRPSGTPVPSAQLPETVIRAALSGRATEPTFTSPTLESPAPPAEAPAGPPGLPGVAELQRMAAEHNPDLQARRLSINAQERMRALAERATLPDLSLSAGYSFRSGLGDFLSFMLSAPIPVFAGRKQGQAVVEAGTVVDRERASLQAATDELNERIASLMAEVERARNQLLLLDQGILPQARTGLASATAAYRVGGVDFLTLLDAQVNVFRHELDYHRLLTDFATRLAALERAVGTEVLP